MKYLVLLIPFCVAACTTTPSPQPFNSSIAPERVITKDLSASQPTAYKKEK